MNMINTDKIASGNKKLVGNLIKKVFLYPYNAV